MHKNAHVPYTPKLKDAARENRKKPTKPESRIWNELLRNRFMGFKFLRQKPLDSFIADFYCSQLLLVIEIDGDSHAANPDYDFERTKALEKYGVEVVRYTNRDVMENIEGVYSDLKRRIALRKEELGVTV